MFANNKNCPSHPQLSITKICLNKDCVEPLCDLCLQEHLLLHHQLRIAPNIRPIQEVHLNSAQKQQIARKSTADQYNKKMTCSIVKGYVDDFYKKINVNQGKQHSPQKNSLGQSDVKSVIEGMLEDNRTTVNQDFKNKLFGFLQKNLTESQQNFLSPLQVESHVFNMHVSKESAKSQISYQRQSNRISLSGEMLPKYPAQMQTTIIQNPQNVTQLRSGSQISSKQKIGPDQPYVASSLKSIGRDDTGIQIEHEQDATPSFGPSPKSKLSTNFK